MTYSAEQKLEAKKLFLNGMKVSEISDQLNIERRTLYNWINLEHWGEMLNGETVLYALHRRMLLLIDREGKTDSDYREMEHIEKTIRRMEKPKPSNTNDDNVTAHGNASRKKKKERRKNDFTDINPADIYNKFSEGLFAYQLDLWEHKDQRIRDILKSRQIGLTYYFAREAFADALMTGDNQIFLSASRNQADVFRQYIKQFCREWFDGYELKGQDTIEIHTAKGTATLYFLSTNSATAQSYHGHVYVDEYFWIPKFDILNKVASAMASQKRWRKTYFSTPSAKSHSAYPFWSMDIFNERMKNHNKALIPFPTEKELKEGVKCADGQYRKLITIYDAQASGCDLFDIEQLKLEYSELEFEQLFLCKFIDDSASIFKLSQLEKCFADSAEWKDFHRDKEKPYKYPVWIGYDPSRNRDGACIVVLAVPHKINGKFRVLERIKLINQAWQYQAAVIKELVGKYDVRYIGIDVTGPGNGVFEMVRTFYPNVTPIFYTMQEKTKLVLKAQQVIDDQRIMWDAEYSDIPAGFMQIRQTTSQSGQITYVADRTEANGHADAAWAIMHALINEGLLREDDQPKATVCFSEAC